MCAKLLPAVTLLSVSCLAASGAEAFEAEGILTKTVFRQTNVQLVIKRTFHVRVSGCESRYKTWSEGGDECAEVSSDSVNVTRIESFTVGGGGKTNHTAKTTEKRSFPKDAPEMITYLWLAYGSACYLDKLSGDTLEPIWLQDDFKEGHQVRAFWSRGPDNHLPHDVAYMSDGIWRFLGQNGKPMEIKMPPPFDVGFTNATYKILQSM